MRVDYNRKKFTKVRISGILYEFSDMRIDRNIILAGKYQHEVAGDDERGGNQVRVYS